MTIMAMTPTTSDNDADDEDADDDDDMEDMFNGREPGEPAFCVVVGVQDAEKAEALVKELGAKVPGLDPTKSEVIEQGGQQVSVNGDYGHFIADSKLVIGNKDLVLATAAQWQDKRPCAMAKTFPRQNTKSSPSSMAIAFSPWPTRFSPPSKWMAPPRRW